MNIQISVSHLDLVADILNTKQDILLKLSEQVAIDCVNMFGQ